MTSFDIIRKRYARKLRNFKKGYLLVNLPCGIGKSYGAIQLLKNKEVVYIYLCQSHKICDELLDNFGVDVPHIRGIKQLCNNDKRDLMVNNGIPIGKTLCKTCDLSDFCEYKMQINDIMSNPRSFISVQSYLNTPFLKNFIYKALKMEKEVILILDEDITNSLKTITNISIDDLNNTRNLIQTYTTTRNRRKTKVTKELMLLCKILIKLLEDRLFMKSLEDNIKNGTFDGALLKKLRIDLKDILDEYSDIDKRTWNSLCNNLSNLIEKQYDNDKYIKNIIYPLKDILNSIAYADIKTNINFTITKIFKDNAFIPVIKHQVINTNLPPIPTIILDASGTKEYYEEVFDTKFKVYGSDINIPRKIWQIQNGKYPISSIGFERGSLITHDRIFNAVLYIVKTHKNVGIITMSKVQIQLKHFLNKNGYNVPMEYYGNLRSSNSMKDVSTLIVLGTPEPNLIDYPFDVGCYYIGQPLISTKRRVEDDKTEYYYTDYRYRIHIERIREREIEQAIDRIRFDGVDKSKKVFLLTKLPINFKTHPMMLSELFKKVLNPYVTMLKVIDEYPVWVDAYHQLQRYKVFKEYKITDIRDELLRMDYIIKNSLFAQITDFGHDFLLPYMEKMIHER